jgi:hypothetical protein
MSDFAAKIIVNEKDQSQLYSSFDTFIDFSQKNTINKYSKDLVKKRTLFKNKNRPNDIVQPSPAPNITNTLSNNENTFTDSSPNLSDLFIFVPEKVFLSLDNTIHTQNRLIKSGPSDIIKQTVKQVLNENSENELINDSIIAISYVKQQIDETEEIINEIAGELLLSIDPDQLIFSNTETSKQSDTSDLLSSTEKSVTQIYQEQMLVKDFSHDNQNKLATHESPDDGFLKKIIHINTLFYLLAILVISPVIQRIINFLMFGKYRKSLNN